MPTDNARRCIKLTRLGIFLVVIFMLVCLSSAYQGVGDGINITVNLTGDNFILWRWDNASFDSGLNLTKTVFVDQVKKVDNSSLNYYLATDINPDEEHIIEVRGYNLTLNTLNTTSFNVTKTYEQNVWYPFLIGTGLLVTGWFTAPVLILASAPVYLLGFGMARDMTAQSYIFLLYGLGFVLSLFIFGIRWYR